MNPGPPNLPGRDHGPWWGRVARRRGRLHAEPSQVAFVLAGGGSRGAVQVGMLAALVDRGIGADRVYGASVGAVNAAAYCGDPTPAGMEELERVWRSLSGDLVFPRGRGHGPWTFFQQRSAVHANTGLRRILEDGVRFDRLEDAHVPLEVVATSLTDGRECWLTEGPVVDAVLASAAIPAMFPPVTIGGELLIDGGVVDNVPISRAIEGGARTIYVLLCGPLHYRPRAARRPAEAVVTAFFVAVHARFARELVSLPPGVEVVVFSGGGDPAADYRDFSSTAELVQAGRDEVARVLDGRVRQEGRSTPGPGAAECSLPGVEPTRAPPTPAPRPTPAPPFAARLSRPAGGMGER
jgi:NTE family protein